MQNNKIQELTDKLYQEGLSKGQQEAAALEAAAKKEAEKLLADARAEAEAIRAKALSEAEETQARATKEMRMAFRQMASAIRQELEQTVTARAIDQPVRTACQDVEFVKQLLAKAVESFNPRGEAPCDLSVILPDQMQQACGEYLQQVLHETLCGRVDIQGSSTLRSGFRIGPAEGGYHLSFTDEDFEALLKAYLRPRMVELLFGNAQ